MHHFTEVTKHKHTKKLKNLGFYPNITPGSKDALFNLSDYVLSDEETNVLSSGFKFSLGPPRPSFPHHFLRFETLLGQLKGYPPLTDSRDDAHSFKSQFKALTWTYYHKIMKYYKSGLNYSHECVSIVKRLAKLKNLVITRMDKGNGVVLMNRSDYLSKMADILSDTSKFTISKQSIPVAIRKIEDKLIKFLRKLKDSSLIDDMTYRFLRPTGSVPGLMYGLPKVHKQDVPLRPILSAMKTAGYNIAKYLTTILSPLTVNKYTIKDSFTFAKDVAQLNFKNCFMASFDVKSLFTNIPLDETISLASDLQLHQGLSNFDKDNFTTLLGHATKDNVFLFNGQLYEQIDGVAMGSPLAPSLANIFLCHHEVTWLEHCPIDFKPLYYRRYVDDTFVIFKDQSHVNPFLEYLNACHPSIQFTHEVQVENCLSFLDINISHLSNGGFETSIFRKPTYTGLISLFSSFGPISYKSNLIVCLVHRAWQICSSFDHFDTEMWFLHDLFSKNGYPEQFFWKFASRTLTKLYKSQLVHTVPKPKIFVPLDYFGYVSDSFKVKFKDLISSHYPQISLHFAFRRSNTIGSFFCLKDKIPNMYRSRVVYQYTCGICHDTYIGKTMRSLETRACEHAGLSPRTHNSLAATSYSAIRDHMHDHGSQVDLNSFKILASAEYDFDLKILEALYTHKLSPAINNIETTLMLHTLS